MAVGAPNQFLSIAAEHGEAIEFRGKGDLLEASSIGVYQEQIKFSPSGVMVITGENDLLTVRVDKGREARPAKVGDLAFIGAVGIHQPDIHVAGAHKIFFQQGLISGDFFLALERGRAAINDLLAIP